MLYPKSNAHLLSNVELTRTSHRRKGRRQKGRFRFPSAKKIVSRLNLSIKINHSSIILKIFQVIEMQRFGIAGLGAFALLTTVPFFSQISGSVLAQPAVGIAQNVKPHEHIQLRLAAEKQVLTKDQQGKQSLKWQPLPGQAVVRPGDILRYTLTGENKSDRPLKNLILNQPIPKGMVYVLKSVDIANKEAKITYSIDGGRNFGENPTVKVTLPDGKVALQSAPATAYTNIRLQVPSIAAKTTLKATYLTQVR